MKTLLTLMCALGLCAAVAAQTTASKTSSTTPAATANSTIDKTVTVDSKADITQAGLAKLRDRSARLPVKIALTSAPDQVLTISATGKVSCCGNGGPWSVPGDVGPYKMPLRAVFLNGGHLTHDPADLKDDNKEVPKDFTPRLGKLFIIGNGKTSKGTTRTIHVPAGATALYFGIWDEQNQYGDNVGRYQVHVHIEAPPQK